MADFSGLLRNELVKIVSRWSNRALAILLILVSVGAVGLQWFSVKSGMGAEMEQEGQVTLQTQIETLQAEQPEDYEEQIDALEFLLANNINVNENNWRLVAAQRIADDTLRRNDLLKTGRAADREAAETLTDSIDRDRMLVVTKDYRGYYEKKLADTKEDPTLSEVTRQRQLWQYQYVLDQKVAAEGNEWKYNLMLGLVAAMKELESQREQQERGTGLNRRYEQELVNTIAIAQYRIENEKSVVAGDATTGFYYEEPSRFWQAMKTSIQAIVLLTLAVIILAGSSVAGEFSSGTVKLLLCVPAKRWKILLAKYLSVLICSFVMLAGCYIVNLVSAGCFFGFADAGGSYIYAVEGQAVEVPGFAYIGWQYLLQSVQVLVYGAAAFCLGALLRSTALAVGLNALFLFAGPYAVSWLKYTLGQDWARFLLFSNLNLTAVWNGQDVFPGQNVVFALVVIVVHMALFLLITWDAFVYRDLK